MTTNSANTANTAIAKEAVETNGAQSQQTDPPTLQLDNVSYAYTKGGKRVLKNISHDFQAGKVHAITGPSGAGKTTLLSLISGLATPRKAWCWSMAPTCRNETATVSAAMTAA